jgi:hypothetical protein
MKKLLMILTVLLVGAASAGTVTWSSSALKEADEDGKFTATALSGAIAYLFVGDGAAAAATASAIEAQTFTGAGALSSAPTTGAGVILKSGIGGSYVSQDVTLYMAIFNTSAIAGSDYYMVSSPVTKTFGATGNQTFTYTTLNGKLPSEWTAVPEPTSFALVGLGAAALALRRRIRKA